MQKTASTRPYRTALSLICLSLLLAVSGCEVGGGAIQQQDERLFDYREIELDNGLKVVTLEDFSCPIVAAQVWYHVGSKDEDPERQGFAHMFEHMMFKGTDRVGPKDHFGFIRRVGGTNNAYTSFDTTVYIQTLPADQLELALWLEAERMTFLKIDQDAFDTERKVVEEELRMGENRPYGTLLKRVAGEIFKVHPYQWTPIGNLGHLRSATVGELRAFWKRYYVPNNATLVIVGAVKHKEAQDLARKYFGWVPAGAEPGRVTIREPETGARQVVFDDENAPAGLAGVGWRTVPLGHADEVVLDLLSNILGGGNSSRLYRELVAEKQLAVVAMATTWNLEHDGLFVAGALEGPLANADVLLEAIGRHVDKLKTEPVSDEELEKARNQMLKSLVTRNLTIGSKARTLGTAAVEKNDTERVNTLLAEIQAVTKADLMRVANKYLADDRTLTLIVERNLKGMMAGSKDDEDIAVTAEREETAPPPGREGVTRGDDFPSEAPVAELAASQPMPGYDETKLANGLKVIVVENHEVPFVSVRLGLLSGAWTESKPGTASMAMQMLTKGTGGHTEAELAEELERYAISLRGSAGMDTASVYANCLTEHLDRAMDLMAEVVLEPAFLKEEFDKLRTQVITGLEIEAKTPRYLADKEFRRLIYGKHPYARTTEGEISDVEALTARDLKRWWGRFARPDEGTLIFAGDISEERAIELAEKVFGDWQGKGTQKEIDLPDLPQPKKTRIYIVDQPGSMQCEIRVGHLGITRHDQPAYFVSRIVNDYFGGSFNSRLNDTIRVKKGLTYGASGGFSAQRFGGNFKIGTFTKNESAAETVQTIFDEIDRLAAEKVGKEELADSKSYIAGSFVRGRETPQQVAEDIWLIESQDLGKDYLGRLLDKIANTSRADCSDLVNEKIDPEKMTVVVVGDASKIKNDLKKIAPVRVIRSTEK